MLLPDSPDLPSHPEPADLSSAAIEEAVIDGASLAGERRLNLLLVDVVLRDCDLANLDARGCSVRRAEIATGRLTGCDLGEGIISDAKLDDCRAPMLGLYESKLERVRFVACDLSQANLCGATLRDVAFERCNLTEADLGDARFQDVELRDCNLDGIRGAANFRGVKMPWQDVVGSAGIFAAACGVEVIDER